MKPWRLFTPSSLPTTISLLEFCSSLHSHLFFHQPFFVTPFSLLFHPLLFHVSTTRPQHSNQRALSIRPPLLTHFTASTAPAYRAVVAAQAATATASASASACFVQWATTCAAWSGTPVPPKPLLPLFVDQDTVERAHAAITAIWDTDKKLLLPDIITGLKVSSLDIHEYFPSFSCTHLSTSCFMGVWLLVFCWPGLAWKLTAWAQPDQALAHSLGQARVDWLGLGLGWLWPSPGL